MQDYHDEDAHCSECQQPYIRRVFYQSAEAGAMQPSVFLNADTKIKIDLCPKCGHPLISEQS